VWLASNGVEAIEIYRTHRERIAVILLDVRMPDRDGPQTLDTLRELNPAVPACFMTGDGGDYAAEDLIRRGASYVTDKPFVLNDLARLLRHLAYG
jgi:CheY-like chemotaxis protein